MNKSIYSVSVFCGSHKGHNPIYAEEARALGGLLAQYGFQTVFGGCDSGLMQELGKGVTEGKGLLTSVYPYAFARAAAPRFPNPTHTHSTSDITEQRKLMRKVSQAAIVLPGSINSLSELLDLASANDANAIASPHDPLKPIIICNIDGFYDGLKTQLDRSIKDGFTNPAQDTMFHFTSSSVTAIAQLLRLSCENTKAGVLRPASA